RAALRAGAVARAVGPRVDGRAGLALRAAVVPRPACRRRRPRAAGGLACRARRASHGPRPAAGPLAARPARLAGRRRAWRPGGLRVALPSAPRAQWLEVLERVVVLLPARSRVRAGCRPD